MNWLIGGRTGEAKRLISQLADVKKRDRSAQELIRLNAEAVPALIEALQTKDAKLLSLYRQVLVQIGAPAIPILRKALTTAHPIIRGRIVEVLAQTKSDSATPALLDASRSEFYTVRAKAVTALGIIGNPEVIDWILPALRDSHEEVRSAAVLALGKFRLPFTFDKIANVLLDDPIIEVRQAAARALGNTKHPTAAFFLMEALQDSFWWYEREDAAHDLLQAIENIGSAAVDALIEALGNREGTVRKFAAEILGKIGDPRAIEELGMTLYDLHHEVGGAAAESLAKFGPLAIQPLRDALVHPEGAVREIAVMALGSIQNPRVAPLIIDMLKDPNRMVQKQAIQALGQIDDPRAISALQIMADDRSDRELSILAKQVMENGNKSTAS